MYSTDADVFVEIKKCLERIKRSIIFIHVKGHQDRQQQPLSFEAFINCEADKLATDSLTTKKLQK